MNNAFGTATVSSVISVQIMRSVFRWIFRHSAIFMAWFSAAHNPKNAFGIILHSEETPIANEHRVHRGCTKGNVI